WAPTAEPAEVPMMTSESTRALVVSADSSSIPRRIPISQAMPASPPPASTSARFDVTPESVPTGDNRPGHRPSRSDVDEDEGRRAVGTAPEMGGRGDRPGRPSARRGDGQDDRERAVSLR